MGWLSGIRSWSAGKAGRRLTYLAGGLAVVLAALAFAAPPLLRGTIERQLAETLQRPVTLTKLGFNPLTLRASIVGLRIGGRAKEPPMLELDRASLRLSPASIWHRAVVVSALRLEGPRVYIARVGDNRYSFSDILDRLAAKPGTGEPTPFALYNLELIDGRLRFEDQPRGIAHHIENLNFSLPFLSSVPADVEVFVQPHLAAKVDGTAFELTGKARPFLDAPEASLDLDLAHFDLVPLLAYLPVKPAVTLTRGRLATRLKLQFRQPAGKPPALQVSGRIEALDWQLAEAGGAPLGGFRRFAVDVAELDPAAQRLRISDVALEGLETSLRWDKERRIGVMESIAGAIAQFRPKASAQAARPVAETAPWTWSVAHIGVSAAKVDLFDAAAAPAFEAIVTPIDLDIRGLASDLSRPFELRLALGADGGESLHAQGKIRAKPFAWDGVIDVDGLRPARGASYVLSLVPGLIIDQGSVSAHLPMQLITGSEGVGLALKGAQLAVDGAQLRLAQQKAPFFKARRIELSGIDLDQVARSVAIAAITLDTPELSARHGRNGPVDLLELAPAAVIENPGTTRPAVASKPASPWRYAVESLTVKSGALRYEDSSRQPALRLALAPLALSLSGISSEPGRQADLRFESGWNKGGRLAVTGSIAPQPLRGQLKIDGRALDVVPLVAQLTEHYEVSVTRAHIDARGDLAFDLSKPNAPRVGWRGNLGVGDFSSLDLINDTDFVRWREFRLQRVDFQLDPLSLTVGDILLSKLQTRLILDPAGNLNLREVARARRDEVPAAAALAAVAAPARAGPATVAVKAPPRKLPPIRIDRLTLADADIRYSDRFIKPNFDANLIRLRGVLNGLSSVSTTPATLQLSGAVDGGALLEINGQFAPFRQDRYLDIRTQVKGYELSALSSYSGKYIGYGIEKGKLSMDLRYRIEDRKLSADNTLFLDQLTLGDKVDSPDATTLPVKFALSLLKNGRGEIDLNLPIAGTLDDPEFSVGGIIWKMVLNFFGKVLASPFSFLSGGSGDAELSSVPFAAGSARLGPEATKRLETIAKGMADRPAITLELTGRADPDADMLGLRRETLQRKMRTEKLRQMARAGESGGALDEVTISAREYPELLERVYKDEKFDAKPRNALGLAKSLPAAEMERLLLENSGIREADLRALAHARANAVMLWLVESGRLPQERIYILAPHLGADPDKAGASGLQVDFSLR